MLSGLCIQLRRHNSASLNRTPKFGNTNRRLKKKDGISALSWKIFAIIAKKLQVRNFVEATNKWHFLVRAVGFSFAIMKFPSSCASLPSSDQTFRLFVENGEHDSWHPKTSCLSFLHLHYFGLWRTLQQTTTHPLYRSWRPWLRWRRLSWERN